MADFNNSISAEKRNGYILKVVIGFIIMFGFGFLPAPAPLTQIGMHVIGIFLGLVFLWTTVDLIWPSILAVVAISAYIQQVFPNIFYENGAAINGAIGYSVGNWVTTFMITSVLLAQALTDSGFTKRITLWFLSMKVARSSPWGFTAVFIFSALFVGCFIDAMPAAVFYIALAHNVCKELGYKIGDKYPMVLMIGSVFAVNIAFGMTPISHPLIIILLQIFSQMTSLTVSIFQFMLVAVPIGLIVFVLMMLFFKFIVKPDMSKFEGLDLGKIAGEKAGKMDKREKMVVTIFMIVVVFWVLPGFLDMIAPTIPLNNYLHSLTITIPAILGLVALLILKADGKPLLDFTGAVSQLPWGAVMLVASVMLVGPALTQEATGFSAFVASVFVPMSQGLSSFWFTFAILAVVLIVTSFTQNVPTAIVMLAAALPMAANMGVNPVVLAILVSSAAQYAFCIPPAFATLGLLYGDEWIKSKRVLTYGIAICIISIIVFGFIGVPFANLIVG